MRHYKIPPPPSLTVSSKIRQGIYSTDLKDRLYIYILNKISTNVDMLVKDRREIMQYFHTSFLLTRPCSWLPVSGVIA